VIDTRHLFALEVRRGGTALPPVRLDPDFGPALEAARFAALRRGCPPDRAFVAAAGVVPRWDEALGPPYLEAVTVATRGAEEEGTVDLSAEYFGESIRRAVATLVRDGRVTSSDTIEYRLTAFPIGDDDASVADGARLAADELPIDLAVTSASLGDRLARAKAPAAATSADDCPVFIPERVIDEAMRLAREADGVETGAFLAGRLWRDEAAGDVFLEVTELLPARHTQATVATLTFTPETWWDVRAALTLRGRGEHLLGWVHQHLVSRLCASHGCSETSQRRCPMARDFFSAHDRLLHRTMFPRGYAVALVVNDWAFAPMSVSLFGYRAGLIEPRPFHQLSD
jgi:hypothetical protein